MGERVVDCASLESMCARKRTGVRIPPHPPRMKTVLVPQKLLSLWRQGDNDFLKARVAAKGIPKGTQFQFTIGDGAWRVDDAGKLFASEVFITSPASDHCQI